LVAAVVLALTGYWLMLSFVYLEMHVTAAIYTPQAKRKAG
jgi:hypothetical protein